MKRKPVPPICNISSTPSNHTDRNVSASNVDMNQTSQNSTPPQERARQQMTFDDIDKAITEMEHQFLGKGHPSTARNPQPFQSASAVATSTPPRAPSLPRPPSAHNASFIGNHRGQGQRETQRGNTNHAPAREPPVLPTINSGEALDWDYPNFDAAQETDPFTDSAATAPLNPHSGATTGYKPQPLPPPPADYLGSQGSYSRTQTPYTQYDNDSYSRPNSAFQNQDSYSQPAQDYDREDSLSPQRPYSSKGYQLPTHYDSQGEVIADHFQHDSEAYASGIYSHNGRRQMRSRSATPMGGEDYSGYADRSTEYNATVQDQDPEKGYGYDPIQSQYVLVEGEGEYTEKTPVSDFPKTPTDTHHYGPAPVGRVTRRHKQKKHIQLTNGNLVVNLPIPSKLILPLRREEEMMHTRYTAVTCDPDDFAKSNFFLRQNELGRTTEMFIVITMYNVSSHSYVGQLCYADQVHCFRKMKFYFVVPYMALCEIFRICAHERIRRHGVRMLGRRSWCASLRMGARRSILVYLAVWRHWASTRRMIT